MANLSHSRKRQLTDSHWFPLITHAATVLVAVSVMFLGLRNPSTRIAPAVNPNVSNVNVNGSGANSSSGRTSVL
jgi:hypothetical protein